MSIKAMNWAWSVEGLRPAERLVLLALADYADETGSCFPSQEALAERACCSTRTVRRVLDLFVEVGIISRSYRYVEGERSSNRYVLTSDYRTNWPVGDYRTKQTELAAKIDTAGGHLCPTNHQNHQNHQLPPIVPRPSVEDHGPGFDEWWAEYPLKKDKGTARRAFARAVKKASVSALIAAAVAYREDPNRDPGFTKYPASWLNAEAWENGPLPPRAASQSGGTAVERMIQTMRSRPVEAGERHAIES